MLTGIEYIKTSIAAQLYHRRRIYGGQVGTYPRYGSDIRSRIYRKNLVFYSNKEPQKRILDSYILLDVQNISTYHHFLIKKWAKNKEKYVYVSTLDQKEIFTDGLSSTKRYYINASFVALPKEYQTEFDSYIFSLNSVYPSCIFEIGREFIKEEVIERICNDLNLKYGRDVLYVPIFNQTLSKQTGAIIQTSSIEDALKLKLLL